MNQYHYQMSGVTHVGKTHAENQDSILMREIPIGGPMGSVYLIGVADGISSTPYGGSVARWVMERNLAVQDDVICPQQGSLREQLEAALQSLAAKFQREFADNGDMLRSGAALAVAGIQGSYAECFWAGDVAIFSSQFEENYRGRQVSKPDWGPAKTLTRYFGQADLALHHAKLRLAQGDTLTIASDGANMDEHVLQDAYGRHGCGKATLESIMAMALRSPRADDVSIVNIRKEP